MFDNLKVELDFIKEKLHYDSEIKDGDKWFLLAGTFVLAEVQYQEYTHFSIYEVSFKKRNKDTNEMNTGFYRGIETLEAAKEIIYNQLELLNKEEDNENC